MDQPYIAVRYNPNLVYNLSVTANIIDEVGTVTCFHHACLTKLRDKFPKVCLDVRPDNNYRDDFRIVVQHVAGDQDIIHDTVREIMEYYTARPRIWVQ